MPKSKVRKKGNSKKSGSDFLKLYVGLFLTATVGLVALFKLSPLFQQLQPNAQVLQSTSGTVYPEHFYVMDNSGSITSDRLKIEKNAVNKLIDKIVPPRGGVYKFTDVASLLANLTTNKTTLHNAANSLKVADGGSRNFKLAIDVAVDKLLSQNAVCPAIVLLSDGKFSTADVRDAALNAAATARSKGVAVYGIAAKPRSQQDSDFVKDLAKKDCAGSPHCGEFQVLTSATFSISKLDVITNHMKTRCSSKYTFTKSLKLWRDGPVSEPSPDQGNPGDRAVYTVLFTNTYSADLQNIVITDIFPDYMTYLPGSAVLTKPDGTTVYLSPSVRSFTATVGTVPPGKSAEFRFATIINQVVPNGTVLTNKATVNGTNITTSDAYSYPITIVL